MMKASLSPKVASTVALKNVVNAPLKKICRAFRASHKRNIKKAPRRTYIDEVRRILIRFSVKKRCKTAISLKQDAHNDNIVAVLKIEDAEAFAL